MPRATTPRNKPDTGSTTSLLSSKYLPAALIILLVSLIYGNTLFNGYNMDDDLVTDNHALTKNGISAIPEIFSSRYYKDPMGYAYEYRPIVLTTFAIEHQFFGDNPFISHLLNLIIYALACLLLYRMLMVVFGKYSQFFALAVTLLFVAFPTHTEDVSSIKNRDELLAFIFSLLTLFFAFKGLKKKWWYLLLVPPLFGIALMSKLTCISFAFIVPLTLLLFSEAGITYALTTTLALNIPVAIMLYTQGTYNVLTIESILWGGVFLLIVAMRTGRLRQLLRPLRSLFTEQDQKLTGLSGVTLKSIFTGTSPGWEMLSFFPAITSLAAGALFVAASYFKYQEPLVISLVIILVLMFKGNEKYSWWANVVFQACMLWAIVNYPLHHLYFGEFIFLILIYNIALGNRKLFWPSLLGFIALLVIGVVLYTWGNGSYIIPILLLFARRRKILLPLYFSLPAIAMIIHAFTGGLSGADITYLIGLIPVAILMVALIYEQAVKQIILVYTIIPMIVLVIFQTNDQSRYISTEVPTAIADAGVKMQENARVSKTERPLTYLELPVSPRDPLSIRIGTSAEILLHYLSKTVWPYPMAYYYGYKFIKPMPVTKPRAIIGLVLYFLLFITAIFFTRRNKFISYGILLYLLSIAIYSNYFYPVPGLVGDRFLFVPSLGWAILLVAILSWLAKTDLFQKGLQIKSVPEVGKYIFGAILVAYSLVSFSRNLDWKDRVTLYRHDIDYVSESAQAQNLLAQGLMSKSMSTTDQQEQLNLRKEALEHMKKSLEIFPGFLNTTYDIGRIYALINEPDSALVYFYKALPFDTTFSDIDMNIGQILMAQQKFATAIPHYNRVIRLYPNKLQAYSMLSLAYFRLGQTQQSIDINKLCLQKMGLQLDPLINIGYIYAQTNQRDSALVYYRLAAKINPNDPRITQSLMLLQNSK